MNDIIEFYNIFSPVVAPERFCLDTDFIRTKKKHPSCPKNPKKSNILAGIKRTNGKLEPFLTKNYKESFDANNLFFIIIVTFILVATLLHTIKSTVKITR